MKAALEAEITECNRDGNLSMRLVTGDDDGVSGILSRISRFSNVRNYIVVAGPDDGSLDERGGYHGERVVLLAQSLGLNTCWSATYNKRAVSRHVEPGNKTVCIIAIGYGTTQGENHRSKPVGSVSKSDGDPPEWFLKGVECALLAPTARNQQRFLFTLERDGGVRAEATGASSRP